MNDPLEPDTKMLSQLETRPFRQEQLVNEVQGIYSGLVMLEKKCIEICQQQSQITTKLTNDQWQALIALHRTLLHEHHDFFFASQHPTASPALRRLPTKFESALIAAAATLFTRGFVHDHCRYITLFISDLDGHITKSGSDWKVQGAEVASSLIALILAFGSDDAFLWKAFNANSERIKQLRAEEKPDVPTAQPQVEDPLLPKRIHAKFWENGPIKAKDYSQADPATGDRLGAKFTSSDEATSYVLPVWYASISIVAGKVGDRNCLPFLHFT
ncbi:hypothetical protein LTR93_011417 [Exophiala xenobiotica]|nr:hypothetical protein LTR93_011417 [Exophiala xenobiotica]